MELPDDEFEVALEELSHYDKRPAGVVEW